MHNIVQLQTCMQGKNMYVSQCFSVSFHMYIRRHKKVHAGIAMKCQSSNVLFNWQVSRGSKVSPCKFCTYIPAGKHARIM